MDLLEPLIDAIVQGEEYSVLNILRLSGDKSTVLGNNNYDRKISGEKDILELKIKGDICELIQSSDPDGRTALHWAACNSQSEKLTPILIEKGAPRDRADNKGLIHIPSIRSTIVKLLHICDFIV